MLTLQRFKHDAANAAVIEAIERDGAAILEHALAPEQTARLGLDASALLNDTPNSEGIFHGFQTKRVGAMIAKSPVCRDMALNPTVLAVMDRFLLPHCSAYQLNLSQLIAIGSGERRQITHPDDPMFPFVHGEFQAMINVMWAVDDFTAENGATHVAPGSHKWARDRHPAEDEIIQAEMTKGSCLIYLGSTRHGGGANRTARARRGIVISYCLGWLRQSENQYLAIPKEIARTLPEPLQRLMGYFVHLPNLGMVDGEDPIHCLNGGAPKTGFRDFMPDHIQKALEQYYDGKEVAVA